MEIRNQPAAYRVSPSRTFEERPLEVVSIVKEWGKVVAGPGDAMNLMSGKRIAEVRDRFEPATPHVGVHYEKGGTPKVADVPNPDAPDGAWDPYAFMPRFAFDAREDAFPVSPTFDGDLNVGNNAPAKADGPPGSYRDGVIGGKQALSGGFAVTRKGEYTVLTYSFYYAHNKAADYHAGDYSIAQVYMKPGPDGKLQPAYLATSWHHGSVLTPWKALAKDQDGRPIVGVNLGTHALQPYGVGKRPPSGGLQIAGDGQAHHGGRALGQRLTFETFQGHVKGARRLDPLSPDARPRLEAMRWGAVGFDPLLPEVYDRAPGPWRELGDKAVGLVRAADGWINERLKRLGALVGLG